MDKNVFKIGLAPLLLIASASSHAIPILQIGPDVADVSDPSNTSGGDEAATYVAGGDDTWYLSNDGASFNFNIYNTGEEGWTAYIVLSAVPHLTDSTVGYDAFDVTVSDGTSILSMDESGVGTPPELDPNSLAPHDIFDTYYEVYEVTFDGADTLIGNTEPDGLGGGAAMGRYETISVDYSILDPAMTGFHIDLYTADWDANDEKKIVTAFAPFSHDAQVLTTVPVPAAVWLFGTGLLGLVGVARRR